MIEVNPIITSTSDTPEEIQRALESVGLEAIPVGEPETEPPAEGGEKPPEGTPPSTPAGESAPAQEPGTEPQAEAELEDEEEDEEEPVATTPPGQEPQTPGKRRSRRDRKLERAKADLLKTATDKARIEGENAELRRRLEALEAGRQPQPEPEAAPKAEPEAAKPPLERPKYPKLADFEYDRDKYDEAMEKYHQELDVYHQAILERDREEIRKATETQVRTEIQQTRVVDDAQQVQRTRYQDALKRNPKLVESLDKEIAVSPAFRDVALDSELAYDVLGYLGDHEDLAQEILQATQLNDKAKELQTLAEQGKALTNEQQRVLGQEILRVNRVAAKYAGAIEAHLEANLPEPSSPPAAPAAAPPATPKPGVSRAPAPTPPLRGAPAPQAKDPSKMSTSEYMAFMDSEEGKAYRKTHNLR